MAANKSMGTVCYFKAFTITSSHLLWHWNTNKTITKLWRRSRQFLFHSWWTFAAPIPFRRDRRLYWKLWTNLKTLPAKTDTRTADNWLQASRRLPFWRLRPMLSTGWRPDDFYKQPEIHFWHSGTDRLTLYCIHWHTEPLCRKDGVTFPCDGSRQFPCSRLFARSTRSSNRCRTSNVAIVRQFLIYLGLRKTEGRIIQRMSSGSKEVKPEIAFSAGFQRKPPSKMNKIQCKR